MSEVRLTQIQIFNGITWLRFEGNLRETVPIFFHPDFFLPLHQGYISRNDNIVCIANQQ